MASKRMVNIQLIDSDVFLDMPLSTQALYFHLVMRADDDGFLNNQNRILNIVGSSADDLKLLIAKGFLLTFDTGVIVIKHWRLHNAIRKDRYHETLHKKEKSELFLDENKAYSFEETAQKVSILDDGNQMATSGCPSLGKVSLGKVSLGKVSLGNNLSDESEQTHESKTENDVDELEQLYQGAKEVRLILKDGSEYMVTENDVQEFEQLYPGLNVQAELRIMCGWCKSNPTKRKTSRGIKKFIYGWLGREYKAILAKQEQEKGNHNFVQREYDFQSLEDKLLNKQWNGGE